MERVVHTTATPTCYEIIVERRESVGAALSYADSRRWRMLAACCLIGFAKLAISLGTLASLATIPIEALIGWRWVVARHWAGLAVLRCYRS
jgi:hypothetical protein